MEYDTPSISTQNIWIFCTSERLHRYGFYTDNSGSDYFLEPPSCIVDKYNYEEWKELTENVSKEELDVPNNLFDNAREHPKHAFQLGMKLETVSPDNRVDVCPASVVKILNDIYFLVKVDKHTPDEEVNLNESFSSDEHVKDTWLCTSEHPYIFPMGWAKEKGLT